MGTRLFCVSLLIASFTCGAQLPDRLRIEVVDVRVLPIGDDIPSYLYPPLGGHGVIVAVHEAMRMLSVPAGLYDVVYADDAPVLHCLEADQVFSSRCVYNRQLELSPEQMNDLHETLGYETEEGEREKGEVLLLIVDKSPALAFSSELLGRTTVTSWNGWEHQDMHWSTIACTGWSHLHIPTIAHELGHCFGLYHNGHEDPNVFLVDATRAESFYGITDLMKETWSPLDPGRLKTSNQTRVDHHFRVLDTEPQTVAVPVSRAFH